MRHCHYSTVSAHKRRLPHTSHALCFENFMRTVDPKRVNVTLFLDTFHPAEEPHFIQSQDNFPIIEIREGTETGSFLKMLEHVAALKLSPETIVYFLEDDYLHRPGWVDVLLEGFTLPRAEYVTLYDHRDKYFLPQYENLSAQIFHTASCHWRTTPSTTNTYAMRFKTLLRDLPIHRQFSEGCKVTKDHEKFCHLAAQGATLISPIPGWSTHTEEAYASPCIQWIAP